MATRYSGDLKINLRYDDARNAYPVTISRGRRNIWSGRVHPAPAGFGSGVAYESPKAYDEIARSALVFADHDGADISDEAEFDVDSGYKVRRVPRFHEQYPPGRHAPKRFAKRDSSTRESRKRSAGRKATEYTRKGLAAEKEGAFSTAGVWFAKAARQWKLAGNDTRARLWERRAKDVRGERRMGTTFRGKAPPGRSRSRKRAR